MGKFLVQMPYMKSVVTAAAVFFIICEVLYGVFSQCTAGQYSIKNMMLRQHIFKTFKTSSPSQCLTTCEEDVRCQSFNYVMTTDVCELNNRTKEARPEHFTASNSRYYFGLFVNRGKEFHRPFWGLTLLLATWHSHRFQLLTWIGWGGKSGDPAGKVSFKLVKLPSLKDINWKLSKI